MKTLTDKEIRQIQIQAKKIIDNFALSLSKVKSEEKSKKRNIVSGFREEGSSKKKDGNFREKMFANAPQKLGDNIIAETKEW